MIRKLGQLWMLAVLTTAGCQDKDKDKERTPAAPAPVVTDGCTPWSKLERCQHAGKAYAVGRVAAVASLGLARSSAAGRARAALANQEGKIELRGSEVPLFARCGSDSLALASAPLTEVQGGASLPACAATAVTAAPVPAEGCPPWTGRIAWREGRQVQAVAVVDGIQDQSLAARVGENRALGEAANVTRFSATLGGGGSSSVREGDPPAASSKETVACGGVFYVKVSVATP